MDCTGLSVSTKVRMKRDAEYLAEDDDEKAPPPKQRKTEDTSQQSEGYSKFSRKMMESMGYVPGKGIGKFGTGIAEPIKEAANKGRLGLGYFLKGLETENVQWELEEIHCHQSPEWMEPCSKSLLTIDDFTGWISFGNRKESIEDETSFCDPNILKKILEAKSIFDNLSEKQFLDARTRSNPFETIKNAIFQNRAAMKMANIDSVFKFMFTNPNIEQGSSGLFYFGDLCAGPGGFSEYVLWRKKWHAKGFGFTLKDPDSGSDFKLDKFLSAPCETFDPHYGEGGYDGDGDITKPENLEEFQKYVLACTENQGVHFVMADGGISVEGQENIQEILTKQLVLCQYLCALSILCKGGNFICKVFDMFTPFSVGLFYLLYRCFERVCLFKPVTSRPANSERYVVCEKLLEQGTAVVEYLKAVNLNIIELKKEKPHLDLLNVVPASVLEEEQLFSEYVTAFNDSFGLNQITHLKKLQYFVKNENLFDTRQSEIRRKCLELWKVPVSPRTISPGTTHLQVFESLWKEMCDNAEFKILHKDSFVTVSTENLDFLADVYSWRWCWVSGPRYLAVGLGRGDVCVWDPNSALSFSAKRELHGLELPKGTVLEIEVVNELLGEGSGQRKLSTAYIMDVLAIHGESFYRRPFKERIELANKLCKAVNKPCRRGSTQLRTKKFHRVTDLGDVFSELNLKECKGQPKPIPTHYIDEKHFLAPRGVIFFKIIKDPWHVHISSNKSRFYYYNGKTRESTYNCPPNSLSSYIDTVASRHLWIWQRSIFKDLCSVKQDLQSTELNRSILCHHISKLTH